jgi:hypothetical protein
MELVEAPSLAQVVEEAPLSHQRAARVGLDVLTALEAAHLVGIVHRDAKPANVLVRPGDRGKLTDFGVATIRDESRLTATGLIVGSPSYMAPEQARGAEVGPPADLWALGAMLYYATEGVPPFLGDSALATASAVVNGDPRPPQRPGALTALIARLLTKDPAARPTAGEARATLSRVARGDRTRQTRTTAAKADGAAAAAAGGAGAAVAPMAAPAPAAARPNPPPAPPTPALGTPATAATGPARGAPATPEGEAPGAARPDPAAGSPTTATASGAPVTPAGEAPAQARLDPTRDPDRPPRDPATGPAPAAGPGRRSASPRGRLGALAALALVTLLVAAGLAATRNGDGDPGDVGSGGTAGPSTTDAPTTTAAPNTTGSTPSTTAPTGTTAPGGDLPPGWVGYHDAAGGYTIGHPSSWRVVRAGGPRIDFRDPATGAYLRVDWTASPGDDPAADWRQQAAGYARRHPGYEEIGIAPTSYRDYNAALWEFRYGANPRLHVANLGFVTGGKGYALLFQAPEADWAGYQDMITQFRRTFQPG